MRIVVTGAAGFVGSHLSERLASLGHEVIGIDNLNDYYARHIKELNVRHGSEKGISYVNKDLAEDDVTDIVAGAELIYHLAAQPGISATTPLSAYLRNNVAATCKLIEAAQANPTLKGFVNIATSSVYGFSATGDETTEPKPASHYGVTKLAAEQFVMAATREGKLPGCSVRLFSVYGPRERPEKMFHKLIRAMLTDESFPLYDGSEKHRRSYTFVGDAVEGLVAVGTHLDRSVGEIFNIGSDIVTTTGEGIEIVEEIIGKKAKIELRPKRPGDQLETSANIEKARRLLGYNPTTSPREGLRQQVEWYRDNLSDLVK